MKKLLSIKFGLLLTAILVLGAILRFPFLSSFPPSMIQDEVGIGYSAISIAQTGMDEWGAKYPMVFKSFGDYKTPVFIYATALLYKVIGWHEVLPRLTSAIAGLFVILCGSLWVRKQFKSDELGLIAGLLFAVNPWTIHLSRMALESNLGLAFFTAGLLFMSYAEKSKTKLLLSALFFSLSTYTFHSYRYTVVLFLLTVIGGTILFNFKELKKQLKYLKTIGLLFVVSTLLSLPGFFSGGATNRLNQTLLFTSEKHIRLYEHYENNCHNTAIAINPKLTTLCRLQYNKYSRLVMIGLDSTVAHFNPGFYFFDGDSDPVRNPTENGEFYVFLLPLWMIGALLLLKEYKKHLVVLSGYLVALVPSIVSGNPHATRMSVLIPFFVVSLVLGYQFFKKYFHKIKYFAASFIVVLLMFTAFHVLNYSVKTYASHEITATYLSYAKKVAILSHEYIEKGYTVYADHSLYPEPHIYYAYYNQIDPTIIQDSFAKVYEESEGFSRPKQLGEKMFFERGNIDTVSCEPGNQVVFITRDELPGREPTQIIKDNTELYSFAYVYDVTKDCK